MSQPLNLPFLSELAIIASKYPQSGEGLTEAIREAQSRFGMNQYQAYLDLSPYFPGISPQLEVSQLPRVSSQILLPQFQLPQVQLPLLHYPELTPSPGLMSSPGLIPSPISSPGLMPSPISSPELTPTPPSRSPSSSPPVTRFFPILRESRQSPIYGMSPESDPPVSQNVIKAIAQKYRTQEGLNQQSWTEAVEEAVDLGLTYHKAIEQLGPYFQVGQTDGTAQSMSVNDNLRNKSVNDNLRNKSLQDATAYLGRIYGGTSIGHILAIRLLTDTFGITRAKASELLQPYFPIVS